MTDGCGKINVELLKEQLVYRRVIAEIHPNTRTSALLLTLAVAQNDIIVTFRSGLGRREPDLLVRRLLVDYIGTDIRSEVDCQNAGLWFVTNILVLLQTQLIILPR